MRILALLVLFGLLGCSEGHRQEECLNRDIPVPMIRDMINTSRDIQNSLPKDNKPYHRLLGKLKKCYKRLNVADFKRILEIYDKHVFQKLWSNNTLQLQKIYMNHFIRLKNIFESCETEGKQTLSICARENIKSLNETFAKLKPSDRIKALSEFHNILVWIGLMNGRSTHKEIH